MSRRSGSPSAYRICSQGGSRPDARCASSFGRAERSSLMASSKKAFLACKSASDRALSSSFQAGGGRWRRTNDDAGGGGGGRSPGQCGQVGRWHILGVLRPRAVGAQHVWPSGVGGVPRRRGQLASACEAGARRQDGACFSRTACVRCLWCAGCRTWFVAAAGRGCCAVPMIFPRAGSLSPLSRPVAAPDGKLLGARVALGEGMRPDAWLFGESQARMLLSTGKEEVAILREYASGLGVPLEVIGTVGGDSLVVGSDLSLSLDRLKEAWEEPAAGRTSEA